MSCNSVAVSPQVFVLLVGFGPDFLTQIHLSHRLDTVLGEICQVLDLTVKKALADLSSRTIVAGIWFAIYLKLDDDYF